MMAIPKEYVVIIFIGIATFGLWHVVMTGLATQSVLRRRAILWLVLTSAAFFTPGYWSFIAIAAPVLLWSGKRDPNPIALYVFLINAVPPVTIPIPLIGAHGLFDLNNYRLLSLTILLPLLWRIRRTNALPVPRGQRALDYFLMAFILVKVIRFTPPDPSLYGIYHETLTDMLRRVFLLFIDVYAIYYAVGRFCQSRERLREAVIYACIGLSIVAGVASFEYFRHWYLYSPLLGKWSTVPGPNLYAFTRDEHIRALATGGQAISLGYELAVGFGIWLYIRRAFPNFFIRAIGSTIFIGGLISAYSRGPWFGAIAIAIFYEIFHRQALIRFIRIIAVIGLVIVTLLASPLGSRIANVLPILGGQIDSGDITYRDQLATQSWQIIKSHPLFGTENPYAALKDLRQGEGIIDFVNTYAEIGVSYGLFGLVPFAAFLFLSAYRAFGSVLQRRRNRPGPDDDWERLGSALTACIAGTAIMIAGCSFIFDFPIYLFTLCGLASAYVAINQSENLYFSTISLQSHSLRAPNHLKSRKF